MCRWGRPNRGGWLGSQEQGCCGAGPTEPAISPSPPSTPFRLQLLTASGVAANVASAAELNASLAALPSPLLDLRPGAQVQLQALQAYQAATTWIANSTTPV